MNIRTEFRLDPDETYLPNLRICELLSGKSNGHYLYTTGVASLIKAIYFYDGNIQIDQCQRSDLMATVKNLLKTNRAQYSVEQDLTNTNWAFTPEIVGTDVINQNTSNLTSEVEGYLELKNFLSCLNSTPYFRFKNPRIVIEWNTSKTKIFTPPTQGGVALDIQKPILLADKMIGVKPDFKGINFFTYEVDRLSIDAVANGADSGTKKYRVLGFDNKVVNRLLLCFTPSTGNIAFGENCSVAQLKEEYQVYLNDEPVFPSPVTEQTKGMYLESIFGSQSFPLGVDLASFHNQSKIVYQPPGNYFLEHSQSWGACLLDNVTVNKLQISYRRFGGPTVDQQEQLKLIMFAEVNRFVAFNKAGQTVVGYVQLKK